MVRYVVLMKLTEQGIKDIKNAPKRIEASTKALEALGGKVIDFYAVQGKYDYVVIDEFPNDEVAMAFILRLGSAGNVRTTTLKAFTKGQFAAMVKELP